MLLNEQSAGNTGKTWFVLVRIPELILAALVAVLVVFLTIAVVVRYVFDIGLDWSDEVARMLFVWVVFLGFAVAIRHRGNIGVELVLDRLSPRRRLAALLLQDGAVLAFSILFSWEALVTVRFSMMQRLPILQITIAWLYAAVLVAGVLMIIYSVANLIDTLRGRTLNAHADAVGLDAIRHSE